MKLKESIDHSKQGEVLKELLKSKDCSHSLGIDPALDRIGFCMHLVDVDKKTVYRFFQEASVFDQRYQECKGFTCEAIETAFRIKKNTEILASYDLNPRKKPISLGMIMFKEGRCDVLVNGTISHPPSQRPEWQLARTIGGELGELVSIFIDLTTNKTVKSAGSNPAEFGRNIFIEGMALHGNSNSIAILPVLAMVYARVWEACSRHQLTTPSLVVREAPIGTLKKFVTDHGAARKDDIKEVLYQFGYTRFDSDDESDATCIAIAAAYKADQVGKDSSGRIRGSKKAKKKKKKKKKA